MGLNPIKTTNEIGQQYTKYLNSLFFLKNKEFMKQAEKMLKEEGKFVKGPFIEITPPFLLGKSVRQLITEGVLSKEFEQLKEHFPLDRYLYMHQQNAIEKVIKEERNIVVATGTGSGKTECFMLPIIDYLMKQKQEGKLGPGVRALFLYPMNALANDQIARLRKILADYSQITFGRFTGETEEDDTKAKELFKKMYPDTKIPDNEIISREKMREKPPHILLTNYAMLEYLLLRPKDNKFFDGEYADEWKFIVLDEAHTYNGAKGTEISMLLKRLKQRISKEKSGHLRCIATSATLGGGKDAYKDVAKFSEAIFGEKFETSDIIESQKIDLTLNSEDTVHRKSNFYSQLNDLLHKGEHSALYKELKNDENVIMLQKQLQKGPQLLSSVAKLMFKDEGLPLSEKEATLVNIVNLCAAAKTNEDDLPLLPARYHVFVKSLEGAYVTLYPHKKLYLDRHTSEKLSTGDEVPVFELANCQRCGQEYIVGTTENDKLAHVKSSMQVEGIHSDRLEYYMLESDSINDEFDEDEIFLEEKQIGKTPNAEEYILCGACGFIEKAGGKKKTECCKHPASKYIKVWRVKTRESNVNTCFSCGAHYPGLVKRFLTADDPATEVLTKSLYQSIPPQTDKDLQGTKSEDDDPFMDIEEDNNTFEDNISFDEQGRKLLIFSDNRQEAAFFATFLNRKYSQVLWRNAILQVMDNLKGFDDIRLDSMAQSLLNYGNKKNLFQSTMDDLQKMKLVYSYIMKEFIGTERQIGLEGLGMLNFVPKVPPKWGNLAIQKHLGVDREGMWQIFCVLFDTLRTAGAVTFPNDIAPTDEFFAPRNRNVYFKLESQEDFKKATILGWLPREKSSNRRLDYITKLLIKNSMSLAEAKIEARKVLKELFNDKLIRFFIKESYLIQNHIPKQGTLLQLNYNMWQAVYNPNKLYRCSVCGVITNHNINGVCSTYRCDGELKKYNNEQTRFTYYKELYEDMRSIPMVAREHTAQLNSECASRLQNMFEKGDVNILSCSTTFEMGVDVGQLEAVFMRNVPPETANYVQRAGRAGRRTETTAYALTYAKRRSHDLTYYQYPDEIIAGKIKPPYVETNNEKIIERHMYSVVFSWLFKKYDTFFGTTDDFFCYTHKEKNAIEILKKELQEQPADLLAALKVVVPNRLHRHFDLDNWGWVKNLLDSNNGSLILAQSWLYDILNELTELENRLRAERKPSDSILKIKNTYLRKGVLEFLSSNNILPKYGFPVDVVELNILHHGEEAKSINLTRDLKMAISEFAPGSEIIANGKKWTTHAINKSSKRGWPVCQYAICKTCKKIYRYEADLGVDHEEKVEVCCGEELSYYKYVKPVFGFSTNTDAPGDPGEKRAVKSYPTQVIFDAFVNEENDLFDAYEGETEIGDVKISYKYSSRGRLVLINQGFNKTGFRLCKNCGYITTYKGKKLEKHKTKSGYMCNSNYLYNVHFGHDFITDVLELKLPQYLGQDNLEGFWLSLLYAILEGASLSLGISRNEINGCLYYNDENESLIPSIMIYDVVPGGAGHVKKISRKIEEVLMGARRKVSGACGCGEETSCYGCLRNYSNQLFHEILSRGLPLNYLNNILPEPTSGRDEKDYNIAFAAKKQLPNVN